jgi:methionyl-tRNA formyltransferase
MKNQLIDIICDKDSWINPYVKSFVINNREYDMQIIHEESHIRRGTTLFILSFFKVIPVEYLDLCSISLVVHASPLPQGRGWSPLTWQVLEGKSIIPVTLFEAVEKLDSGDIISTKQIDLTGKELFSELMNKQAKVIFELCQEFLENRNILLRNKKKQTGKSSYYNRRTPADSILDPDRTIREQFNLFRVADNDNYPTFFVINGKKYVLKIYTE